MKNEDIKNNGVLLTFNMSTNWLNLMEKLYH